MKIKILGAVSALALMVAVTAYTEANAGATTDTRINAKPPTVQAIQSNLQNDWQTTKTVVSDEAQQASDATKDAYESFRARIIGNDSADADVTINARVTAKGMLDQPINNTNGDKVATLKDIILDKDGNAAMVVVSDGGFMGVGDKLAAFDYGLVMQQQADGDVVMPLTEEMLSKVAPFSYDVSEASDKIHVIPANGYSVSELLKGKILNPQGESLGNIENITFRNGKAAQVIVAFDQKLGLGGERAALDFDDLALAKAADGALNFRMNTRQSAQFEQYKNTKPN